MSASLCSLTPSAVDGCIKHPVTFNRQRIVTTPSNCITSVQLASFQPLLTSPARVQRQDFDPQKYCPPLCRIMDNPQGTNEEIFQFDVAHYTELVAVLTLFGSREQDRHQFSKIQVMRSSNWDGPAFPVHQVRGSETREEAALICAKQYAGPSASLLEYQSEHRRMYIEEVAAHDDLGLEEIAPFTMSFQMSDGENGRSAVLTWWFLAYSWSPPQPHNGSTVFDILAERGTQLSVEDLSSVHLAISNEIDEEILRRALRILQCNEMLSPEVMVAPPVED